MWSAKEGISSANSTVTIDYYDEETNEWVSAIDLLDGSLPQDKDTLKTYYVTFGAGVKSFRVYAKTPATGSSNNGRIVIGDLKVQF